VQISKPGTYNITASDTVGCTKRFTIQVDFKECAACAVFVPNAFTPNGDGRNDVLKGFTNCPLDEYQLQIYNRFGEKVFESSAVNKGWDGTLRGEKVSTGVFVYFVRFKNSSNEKAYKTSKRTVMVLR
jgi:gliding motility-associated-like protein